MIFHKVCQVFFYNIFDDMNLQVTFHTPPITPQLDIERAFIWVSIKFSIYDTQNTRNIIENKSFLSFKWVQNQKMFFSTHDLEKIRVSTHIFLHSTQMKHPTYNLYLILCLYWAYRTNCFFNTHIIESLVAKYVILWLICTFVHAN